MNAPRLFEDELPTLLAELYPAAIPDYRDDILGRTARSRQRPGWTFPERWLPMTLTLRRPALATSMVLVVLATMLLLALLATMTLLPVLSRPEGLYSTQAMPHANGLVAYDFANDIHVVDPVTGESRVLIGDDAMDMSPDWSPDGTRIAFWRRVPESGVMVANADGSDPILVVPGNIADQAPPYYAWSPDSTRLAFLDYADSDSTIVLANVDGSGSQTLDVGMPVDWPVWNPDGGSILFRGWGPGDVPGLYTVDISSGMVAGPIVAADPTTSLFQRLGGQPFFFEASYSPDGSKILYTSAIDPLPGHDPSDFYYRVRMVGADGADDHAIELAPDARSQGGPQWSPDGSRYAVRVEPKTQRDLEYFAIASSDGGGDTVVSAPLQSGIDGFVWAPDGSEILTQGQEYTSLIDTVSGSETPFPLELLPTDGRGADWQPVAG